MRQGVRFLSGGNKVLYSSKETDNKVLDSSQETDNKVLDCFQETIRC